MKSIVPRNVLNNFINLSSVQVITMLVQIMLYPFLIQKIGADEYGKIIFSQLIITYFQVIVVFGTDLAAISNVAGDREKDELSRTFSIVFFGRLLLAIFISGLYISVCLYLKVETVFLLFVISIFEPVFTTRWFYHGRQNLSSFTIPLVLSRLAVSLLIFTFVEDETDKDIVILLFTIGFFFGVIYSFQLLVRKKVKLIRVKAHEVCTFFSSSFRLFLTNILSIAKDRTSGVVIGLVISYELLVYYDFAMKIANVISSFLSSFSSSFYPKFCESFKVDDFNRVSKIVFIVSIVPLVFLLIFPFEIKNIISYIMKVDLSSVVSIFYFYGLLIFVRGHSYFIGLCSLMANNRNKEYTSTLIYSSIFFFLLMSISLVSTSLSIDIICFAYSATLVFEYFHRFYQVEKFKRVL